MRLGIAGVAGMLALVSTFGGFANAAGRQPKERIAAIVLPIDFSVISVGIKGAELLPDPTALARDKLDHSMTLAVSRTASFTPVALPTLSAEDTATFKEHIAFTRANVLSRARDVLANPFPGVNEPPRYSIGPALAFLAERTGAERLIYSFGTKFVSGGGRAALAIALSPIAMVPTRNTEIGVAVVELRTGNITWMNFVTDISADVTDRRGANAYILPAFGDYPKTTLGEVGTDGDRTAARLHEDRNDRITVTLPPDWLKVPKYYSNELTLSRHGVLLDIITIDRVKRKTIKPTMDPLEVGRLTMKEMLAQPAYQGSELDGIEPASVGGLPGFRANAHFQRMFADSATFPVRQRVYGVATEDGLYLLLLESVEKVYFDENARAFDEMVQSLKLGPIKVRPVGQKED